MCAKGSFHLHKFISNQREVIDRAKGIQNLDLGHGEIPPERVLRVEWWMENDLFRFRILLKDKLFTRRGVLFKESSIYDPLWDDPIPDEVITIWER